MVKQGLLVWLVACLFGLSALTALAAAPEHPVRQRLKERQPKKAQQQKARPHKPPQPVIAKASTDTESRITKAGDYRFSIQHGGVTRLYHVHVPAGYAPTTPAPLLVALHGGGGGMDQANEAYYGLIAKSDREGFVAVFPNGFSNAGGKSASWNAGNCCGGPRDPKVDDVSFIRQVVTNLFRQMSIDRNRIYATGISNGGTMAYRLACELPGMFKAVAPVAAADDTGSCKPGSPVSILHFHASNDSQVRFAGGGAPDVADKYKVTDLKSVPVTVAKWAQLNGCTPTPRRTLDKAGAYCDTYSWCRSQAEVQLCVTEGGGHSWPGGKPPRGAETPSQAISATDVMWDFFSHR